MIINIKLTRLITDNQSSQLIAFKKAISTMISSYKHPFMHLNMQKQICLYAYNNIQKHIIRRILTCNIMVISAELIYPCFFINGITEQLKW